MATEFPFKFGIDPVYSTATPNFERKAEGQLPFSQFRDPRFALTQLPQRNSAVRNPNTNPVGATSSGSCMDWQTHVSGELASVDVLPGGITLMQWTNMSGVERIEALLRFAPTDDLLIDALTIGERVGFPNVREAVRQVRIAQGFEQSSLVSARAGASARVAPPNGSARVSGDAANAAAANGAATNVNTNASTASSTAGFSRTSAVLITAAALGAGYWFGSQKTDNTKKLPGGANRKQLGSGK